MTKKWYLGAALVVVIGIIVSGFQPENKPSESNSSVNYVHYLAESFPVVAHVLEEHQIEQNNFEIPFTGKSFIAFKQALALKESEGKYDKVNDFGYAGKYQFGGAALRAVGINNREEFLRNPLLQEEAFKALLAINKHELRNEIDRYVGKVINGTEITESGILASAHLLGAGSVKKYLRNNGNVRITDGYGTTIRSYMKRFAGYDTSIIKPNPNAKALDNYTKKSVL